MKKAETRLIRSSHGGERWWIMMISVNCNYLQRCGMENLRLRERERGGGVRDRELRERRERRESERDRNQGKHNNRILKRFREVDNNDERGREKEVDSYNKRW